MRHIIIPPELSHLKIDPRGFPIPFVVLIDKFGTAHFKVNDGTKEQMCIDKKLCHVCGLPLNGEYWMIGGQLSAFHERGAFNDPPVHKVCGEFALKTCPYMAYTQYKASDEDGTERMAQQLSGKLDKSLFLYNPTQDMKRLTFFVFVKTSNYTIHRLDGITNVKVVKAERPYIETQFWLDGMIITKESAKQLLKSKNETDLLP